MSRTVTGSLLKAMRQLLNPSSRRPPAGAPITAPEDGRIGIREDPDKIAREYAATLLVEARDELNRADQKAAILLAAVGVGVGAILAGLISADWHPSMLGLPWAGIWTLGALAVLAGVVVLVWAIYPRTTRGRYDEASLFYFRQAARVGSVDDLERELRRSSENTFRRSADQVWRISQVVESKYRAVSIAIWLIVPGSLVCLASAVLSEVFTSSAGN